MAYSGGMSGAQKKYKTLRLAVSPTERKLIGVIVAVLVIAWLSLFVSNKQVLVWEVSPSESVAECEQENEKRKKKSKGMTFSAICADLKHWTCTYFNGRRLVKKDSSHIRVLRRDGKSYGGSPKTGCPNFLDRGH